MSFLDDAKKKLTETVNEHGDKIKDGLDKAGRTIDDKTGGKYSEKIQRGTQAANKAMDDFSDKQRATATPAPAPAPADPSPTPDPNAPAPEPGTAPGAEPGGADEPGLPTDPSNPTG